MPATKPRETTTAEPRHRRDALQLPDQHAMDQFIATLGERKAAESVGEAQQIIYDAWDEARQSRRIALARKALSVSPLCADAYVLLAEEEAQTVEDALICFQKGVEAGERAFGPNGFKEYGTHFWGFIETRPYMRARAGLAASLWQLGRHKEAIAHYRAMLKLNPSDNQGIRYVLAGHLLACNDTKALKTLIRKYKEDGSAAWLYTQALLAFREADSGADDLAEEAWMSNSHVPGVLTGTAPLVASPDGYITMGGATEAAYYVEEYGEAWKATPGAIAWLLKATATLKPGRHTS